MSEIHTRIIDNLPPGIDTSLQKLAKDVAASPKHVLNSSLILEKLGIVRIRKPLLGILGDYRIKRIKDVSVHDEDRLKCKVTSVINQKGGVGKTITAINVAGCLSKIGRRTLLVDLDPQGNATSSLSAGKPSRTIYEALTGNAPAENAIIKTAFENLDLMPSDINLVGAEIELVNMSEREMKLKAIIDEVRGSYEHVIIDCPPSLSLLSINALTASDTALIPVQCDYLALDGLKQLLDTINLVKERLNGGLGVEGILLTMFEPQNPLSVKIADEVKAQFKDNVLGTVVHRDMMLSESANQKKPVAYYSENSRSSREYFEVAKELMEHG